MKSADEAIVYYSLHTLEHKKLAPISPQEVKEAFGSDNVTVYTNSQEMVSYLLNQNWNHSNLLLMSSGNFDGLNFNDLAKKVLRK
jgi:UDP-N-acetylmuramate: L-alanyl-gamma-D-glutamyl-meso-diaminopimelate ligase